EVNGKRVSIIVRNISRDIFTGDKQELMERFVRGDSSRNTDGNGLGLSIAKSMGELQGGVFDIILDGDLFKVICTFDLI
ncbi:MAG: sensor histidine kinase, partial [Erysipelothrix sp.]|nr:sensor histidine kinase [Erysipelothrix sp.]